MHKQTVLTAMIALGLAGFGQAQAATYVVTANAQALDAKLERQVQAAGGTIGARLPQIGVMFVESDDAGFAKRAARVGGMRSVIADVSLQFDMEEDAALTEDFANPPASGDNDFYFDFQWGHAAIDAAGAWNRGYRGEGAVVAVLDSGVYCQHADIAPNLLVSLSRSFVPGEHFCNVAKNPSNGYRDDSTHGTHVAGTVLGADNGFGIIGVAPKARLIAVKVLSGRNGSGSFESIIRGIVHAADAGADAINMSLGVRGGLPVGGKEAAELINATKRAVQYALRSNTTVVASAGNDGRDLDKDSGVYTCDSDGSCFRANLRSFPGEVPGVLTISALGPIGWAKAPFATDYDVRASYTNYGRSAIDFAAPGGDAIYPYEDACTLKGLVRPCWVWDMVFSAGTAVTNANGSVTNGFSWMAGTSMAAPHVTGVAALIVGKYGGDLAPAEVARILRASADDLGQPGNDPTYGSGRVNAARAVTF